MRQPTHHTLIRANTHELKAEARRGILGPLIEPPSLALRSAHAIYRWAQGARNGLRKRGTDGGTRIPLPSLGAPVLEITWDVFSEIAQTIGSLPAETGGAFGRHESEYKASAFHFDKSSRTSAVTYSPDYRQLNSLFKTEWNPRGIRLMGFVHSHPGRMSRPSRGDEIYAERILAAIPDMKILWLPIVNTVPDTGELLITPWAATFQQGQLRMVRGAVKVVDVPADSDPGLAGFDATSYLLKSRVLEEIRVGRASACKPAQKFTASAAGAAPKNDSAPGLGNTFRRVQTAYDLPLLNKSRIIAIGAGGAAEWLEQLARAGLGQFVLIDPDTVSEANIATQQVYRRDIGRPKVDCIAERIRDINPTAIIVSYQKPLDALNDVEFTRLAKEPINGKQAAQTLICGLTDNFFAQARVNRLALHLGIPSLCGQVYREGRGCEISFTFPGVTPACHRCILSSRYRYYLEQRRENDVTSDGTPIFATARLNAIKGFIALALLHHGSSHSRWGAMLKRIGNRNLVIVRMDPDFADTIGMKTFDRVFANADRSNLFYDESIWRAQEPEFATPTRPGCPDCGGTGDLKNAIGTIPFSALQALGKTATDPLVHRSLTQASSICQ